jgi:hypothetical protein
VGDLDGIGVGTPGVYVGMSVGVAVGPLVGEADGCGLGLPGVYVGTIVGDAVGAYVGDELGCGVGAASLVKVTDRDPATVTPLLRTTVVPDTDKTVVPEGMPVPVTTSPTAMDATWDADTVTDVDPTDAAVTVVAIDCEIV